MTIVSPLLAVKVHESESPTGEMVPVCVQPLVRVPWALAVQVQRGKRSQRTNASSATRKDVADFCRRRGRNVGLFPCIRAREWRQVFISFMGTGLVWVLRLGMIFLNGCGERLIVEH